MVSGWGNQASSGPPWRGCPNNSKLSMFFLGSDTDVVKSVFVLLRGRTDRVKLVLVFSRVDRSLPEGSRGHTDVVKSDLVLFQGSH